MWRPRRERLCDIVGRGLRLATPVVRSVSSASCRLTVDRQEPLILEAGDFLLLPNTPGFTMSGFEPVHQTHDPTALGPAH